MSEAALPPGAPVVIRIEGAELYARLETRACESPPTPSFERPFAS